MMSKIMIPTVCGTITFWKRLPFNADMTHDGERSCVNRSENKTETCGPICVFLFLFIVKIIVKIEECYLQSFGLLIENL